MNGKLSRIEEKKRLLDQKKPLNAALTKNLEEWFTVELTYTSNAIEGNTLSRQETALIVEKGITVEGKSIREHLEAINHAAAVEHIRTLTHKTYRDITERNILDIHQLILQKIDDANAGRYRTVPVRIAGSRVILPNPSKVPDFMKQFISWLHKADSEIATIAVDAHFKLVSIHPFTDGNGRTARLLMNLILLQAGYPAAIIRKEDRKTYINSVEKGQLTGDLSDYYDVCFAAIVRSLDIYLDATNPQDLDAERTSHDFFTIGEVSRKSNEPISTIRFWTNEGLLKIAKRTKGRYQLYAPSVFADIKKIRSLQKSKRLTIKELKSTLG